MEALQIKPKLRPTLRQSLRDATGDRHARLDAMFEPMLKHGERDLYGHFVAMNFACHGAIEAVLARSPLASAMPERAFPSRLPALRLDMTELGLHPIEMPRFYPQSPDLHESVGIAYVLEGSRLGAALLHKQLRDLSAETSQGMPHNYLAQSEDRGAFRRFMDLVSAFRWDENSTMRAARAANDTFDYYLLAAQRSLRVL